MVTLWGEGSGPGNPGTGQGGREFSLTGSLPTPSPA